MKLYQVDAFTDTPFQGNPAGVCLLDEAHSETWMRDLAREMNVSETAFLLKQPDSYSLRWFTPKVEVQLCGHATLASAHILWEEHLVSAQDQVTFATKSGNLHARKDGTIIKLDFPARRIAETEENQALNHAFHVRPVFTGKYDTAAGELYLLEVASDDMVKNVAPDYQGVLATAVRAVILTSQSSDPRYDFISRYFAPAVGVNEDPVTGSAHCCLAPYWGEKLGKTEMVGFQASERSGVVRCTWAHDRVILGGQAVTVFKMTMLV